MLSSLKNLKETVKSERPGDRPACQTMASNPDQGNEAPLQVMTSNPAPGNETPLQTIASNPLQANEPPLRDVLFVGRHKHMLYFKKGLECFTCSGCKELGANFGYKCRSCPKFVLHESCANLPDNCVHPFYPHCELTFCAKTHKKQHCNGCRNVVGGFGFESSGADMSLHPLCLALPLTLTHNMHTLTHNDEKSHTFGLVDNQGEYNCMKCDKKIRGWKYQCEANACGVYLDMKCAVIEYHRLSNPRLERLQNSNRGKCILKNLGRFCKFIAGNITRGFGEGAANALFSAAFRGDCAG